MCYSHQGGSEFRVEICVLFKPRPSLLFGSWRILHRQGKTIVDLGVQYISGQVESKEIVVRNVQLQSEETQWH